MPIKYPTTSKTLLEKISSGDEISGGFLVPLVFGIKNA